MAIDIAIYAVIILCVADVRFSCTWPLPETVDSLGRISTQQPCTVYTLCIAQHTRLHATFKRQRKSLLLNFRRRLPA